MRKRILEALYALPVPSLSYQEWILTGMALKAEGFDCSVWDEWSKNDKRYHPGECIRKWNSFHGGHTPVTGGTIIHMATARGWKPSGETGRMNWNDILAKDAQENTFQLTLPSYHGSQPGEELSTYIKIMYKSGEHISYVTGDAWQDTDGKWKPGEGFYDRTASQLLDEIKKHPDDLGAVIGDCKPAAGAWIRFNPVDGTGIDDKNVTSFRFALVESDFLPIEKQYEAYIKFELPISCLVYSGNKSLHAIVKVDAANKDEYDNRVAFLYNFLDQHGFPVDHQNKNPSRLSRMPGVTRDGKPQHLVATNIGKTSWAEWEDFAKSTLNGLSDSQPDKLLDKIVDNSSDSLPDVLPDKMTGSSSDSLPQMVPLSSFTANPPALPAELIGGILRCGHKMLISGSSKAGKSFLLMELCIAIAEGWKWLGFPCKKGRVLYINLEIDKASCIGRFMEIYKAMGTEAKHEDDIIIWNLRGYAAPLDELIPKLLARVNGQHFDAIIVDPIYKVLTGDENSASEMALFCNQFDRICAETGSAVIYVHHHSKGVQGSRRAIDRASGSGVFGRDPDALLDMVRLVLSNDLKNKLRDENVTAWRIESNLREFSNIIPVDIWFEYPLHRVDENGELKDAPAEGSAKANLAASGKRNTPEERREILNSAYNACSIMPPVKVSDLAEYAQVDEKTIRRYIKEFDSDYWVQNGIVGRTVDKS